MPSQRLRLAGTFTGLALLAGCAGHVTTEIETTGMANPELALRRSMDLVNNQMGQLGGLRAVQPIPAMASVPGLHCAGRRCTRSARWPTVPRFPSHVSQRGHDRPCHGNTAWHRAPWLGVSSRLSSACPLRRGRAGGTAATHRLRLERAAG